MTHLMLWLDTDSNRALDDKIRRAVDYYRGKYGEPSVCHIHKSLTNGAMQVDGVEVVEGIALPNEAHFRIGVE